MPVIVKDFTWRQSEDKIIIRVPLKGVHSSKVDILTSPTYLKLHYEHFIFEIFLFRPVKDEENSYSFLETEILMELTKQTPEHWDCLELTMGRDERNSQRQHIIEEIQQRKLKSIIERNKRKDALHKMAISGAIELDAQRRETINKTKQESIKEAMKSLTSTPTKKEKPPKIEPPEEKLLCTYKTKMIKPQIEFCRKLKEQMASRVLPPIRKGGTIQVHFSDRQFFTPSRETLEETEKEYLKKINEARRATGFISENLRPEEQDPEWCKRKGDELLKTENYLGAISAYTHGIRLSNKLPSLFSNRAVAHFMIGNFEKCVTDCSDALELMKPACEINLNGRVKCIVRRAAGLTRLGMLSKAIDEMKAAIKLQPNNEKLKQDLYQMERVWEQDPDSD